MKNPHGNSQASLQSAKKKNANTSDSNSTEIKKIKTVANRGLMSMNPKDFKMSSQRGAVHFKKA